MATRAERAAFFGEVTVPPEEDVPHFLDAFRPAEVPVVHSHKDDWGVPVVYLPIEAGQEFFVHARDDGVIMLTPKES